MLITRLEVGLAEFVRQLQERALRMAVEADRHTRASGRTRFAVHESVSEHDALGSLNFEHLA